MAVQSVSGAASYSSAGNGNWNTPTTWTPNGVPGTSDTVTVASGHTITVTVDAFASSITMSAPSANNAININSGIKLTVSGAITMNMPSAGVITQTIAVGAGTLKAASISIPGSGTASRFCTVSVSTGIVEVTGNISFSGTAAQARLISTGSSTIKVGGNLGSGGTLTTSNTGTIQFNGGSAQTIGTYTTYNAVNIANTSGGVTFTGTTTMVALTVEAGTLDIRGVTTTVNTTTYVKNGGTLTFSTSNTGTKTFIGLVSIEAGGTWSSSTNEAVTIRNGITNNGTFTAGTGTYTFTTNAQQINGANKLTFPGIISITTITLTNKTTIEMTGTGAAQLAGSGGFTNAATGYLKYAGSTNTVTTFTSTAVGNTVEYNSTAGVQTIRAVNYDNLVINNAGYSPQLPATTIQSTGSLTIMSGTLDVRGVTITVNGPTTIESGGTLTFSSSTTGTKTFAGTITVKPGGLLSSSIAETAAMNGGLINNGTFSGGIGVWTSAAGIVNTGTFTGGSGTKTITNGGITNDGSFNSGTGGITFTTNNQQIGGSQTLTFGAAITITTISLTNTTTMEFTNTAAAQIAGTNGTFINGDNSTLLFAGSTITVTNVNFTAPGNTARYNSTTTAQTVRGTTYENLIIDKSAQTAALGATTVIQATGGLRIVSGVLNFSTLSFTNNALTTIESGGTINDSSATGTNIFEGLITNEGSWTSTASSAYTIRGGITNNGTFSSGTGLYTFNTRDQELNGSSSWQITSMTIDTITVSNNTNLTILTNIAGTGTFSQEAGAVLNIAKTGTAITANLNATAPNNIVNHNAASAQTIKPTSYDIIKVNNSNTTGASLASGTTAFRTIVIGDVTPNSIFTDAGFTISLLAGSSLEMYSGVYDITSASSILPTFESYYQTSGTTIEYGAATGTQYVSGYPPYRDLTISNASTKYLSDNAAVLGNLTVGSGSTLNPDVYYVSGSGTANMSISGTLLVNGPTFESNYPSFVLRTANTGSTVNYARAGDQTIDSGLAYANLTLTGGGTKSLAAAASAAGTFTVTSPSTFEPDAWTITGTGGTDVLTFTGTINVRASTFAGNYSGFETVTVGAGSTIDYNGTDQSVQDLAYVNLRATGPGIKSLGANESITNILTIQNGATFDCSSFTLGVAGDISVDGWLIGSNTLTLSGTTKNISGTGTVTNPVTISASRSILSSARLIFTGDVLLSTAGSDVTNNGVVTFEGTLNGTLTPDWTNASGSYLDIKGASFLASTGNMLCTGVPNTVRYYNQSLATTVKTGTYHNLIIDVGGQTASLGGTTTVQAGGSLYVSSGTINLGANAFTNNGPTTIETGATLSDTSSSGSTVFIGNILNLGTWSASGNGAFTVRGGIDNYGSFTSGTGLYTFNTNNQTIFSDAPWTITSISVTSPTVLSNNSDLTIVTDIAGTGTFSQEAGATLNISRAGTAISVTSFSANATENTVNHNAASAQTIRVTTYDILKSNNPNTTGASLGTGTTTVKTLIIGDIISNSVFTDQGNSIAETGESTLELISGKYTLSTSASIFPTMDSYGIESGTTVEYAATTGTQNVSTTPQYWDLSLSGLGTKLVQPGALYIRGNWSSNSGAANLTTNNPDVYLYGNFTGTGTVNQGTGVINFVGSSPQTVRGLTTYTRVKVDNPTGVTLSSIATIGSYLSIGSNVPNSILSDGGYQITSASGSLTIEAGAFKLGAASSATTFPVFAGGISINNGSTVEYASGIAQTVSASPQYQDIVISGASTKTLGGNTTINKDLFIDTSSTLDASSNNYRITVKGNWSNSGNFVPRSGSVTFDATSDQYIYGDNNWASLAGTASSARTIFFESGKAQSVASNGTLKMTGSAGQLLILSPTNPGSEWYLRMSMTNVTQDITNISVSYCNAGPAGTYAVADGHDETVQDGGNNTNWRFKDISGKFFEFF